MGTVPGEPSSQDLRGGRAGGKKWSVGIYLEGGDDRLPNREARMVGGGVMFIQPLHQALSSDFLRESAQGVERCLSEGPPPSLRDP